MFLSVSDTKQLSGFTLIEVLISVTIVAMLSVIVFMSLHLASKAWEKGEKDIETNHQERVIMTLLERQLKSILTHNLSWLGEKPFYLIGDPKKMVFLSNIHLIPTHNLGAVGVFYTIVPDDNSHTETLLFFEQPILSVLQDMQNNTKPKFGDDPKEFKVLLKDMKEISFEYLEFFSGEKSDEEEPAWIEEWNSEVNIGFPMAVKVSFQREESSPMETLIVVLMMNPVSDLPQEERLGQN